MNFVQQRWQAYLARRHPLTNWTITLVHKRIYITPTGKGLGFAVLVVVSLIGAINYQLSLGFFFAFLLIGLAHAALLRTYAALLGLEIAAQSSEAVFVGESAQFSLRLADSRGRARAGIVLCSPDGASASADVSAHSHASLTIRLTASQRGWLRLPRSRIECRTPSGWFVAWSYIALAVDCLVYPHPEPDPPPLPSGAQDGTEGMQAGFGDDDFAGLRDYAPGDTARRIAWKQVARTGQLLSKTFQSPLASEVILDWNALASLDTEARLSRLTAWVVRAAAGGHRYALILPGFDAGFGQGAAHSAACLTALALFPPDGEPAR